VVLYPIGGLMSIMLVPLLYQHVLQSIWGPDGGAQYPFRHSFEFSFFVLEVSLVCAFFLLTRRWRYRDWVGAAVLVLHYLLWTEQLWWTFQVIPLWAPKVFYFVFPCSGFAWLFYSSVPPGVEKP
jgi:hypothetical protein